MQANDCYRFQGHEGERVPHERLIGANAFIGNQHLQHSRSHWKLRIKGMQTTLRHQLKTIGEQASGPW